MWLERWEQEQNETLSHSEHKTILQASRPLIIREGREGKEGGRVEGEGLWMGWKELGKRA